jgi:Protein of unknown function (DUF3102)
MAQKKGAPMAPPPSTSSFEPLPIARDGVRGPNGALTDVQFLEYLADNINFLRVRARESILEIGFRLIEAKAYVGHGKWLPWLNCNFGWSVDTAQNYMRAYEFSKNRNFRNLDLAGFADSSLYLLAAPSTPPEAVKAVMERAKAGETVKHEEVKAIVKNAKRLASRGGIIGGRLPPNPPSHEAIMARLAAASPPAYDIATDEATTRLPIVPNGVEKKAVVAPSKFPLKKTIATLIGQYGYEAVSNEVLEHTT